MNTKTKAVCVIFDTLLDSEYKQHRLNELQDAISDLADVFTFIHNRGQSILKPNKLDRLIYLSDNDIFDDIQHKKNISSGVIPGNPDLKIIAGTKKIPKYDYYLRIEDDVLWTIDCKTAFSKLIQICTTHDFCASYLTYEYSSKWLYSKTLMNPEGLEAEHIEFFAAGFLPILAFTYEFIKYYEDSLREGWRGHYEALMPTIAQKGKFRMLDLQINKFTSKKYFNILPISWSTTERAPTFVHPIKNYESYIEALNFLCDPEITSQELLKQIKKIENIPSMESAYKRAVLLYPDQLDQYGHPTFLKEYIRSLLKFKQWKKAEHLIPAKGETNGSTWHEILFARAYADEQLIDSAKVWWDKVNAREPTNSEAKAFYQKLAFQSGNVEEIANQISDVPSMEPQGILLLKRHLKEARVFLEYGAGGSTILAAKIGVKNIYSVESDEIFLNAVKLKIKSCDYNIEIKDCFVDIGKTGDWGYPQEKSCIERWPMYCIAPWKVLQRDNCYPDVILIDGRFRVACFLISLFFSQVGTVILFDDYSDRKEYKIVEKYLIPSEMTGRMAKFITSSNFGITANFVQDLFVYINDPT